MTVSASFVNRDLIEDMRSIQLEAGLCDLKPWAKNARTHSKKQLRQIADSIETFEFSNPVPIDGHGTTLACHGRVQAAKLTGMAEVPCVRLEYMSEDEKRPYVLADNKLALNAGWDEDLPASEFGALGIRKRRSNQQQDGSSVVPKRTVFKPHDRMTTGGVLVSGGFSFIEIDPEPWGIADLNFSII